MDMHGMGFSRHLMGVFGLINVCGPSWLWVELVMGRMVICRNDPQPGDFGAGSLLYKGNMVQMLVNSRNSDYNIVHNMGNNM